MDPLRGKAEQISARTAAVITMKTIEMRNEDLKWIYGVSEHPRGWGDLPNGGRTACEQTEEETCSVCCVISLLRYLLGVEVASLT